VPTKYTLPNKITAINNTTNHDIIFLFADTYPTHSGESFCSSDISLDDSTNFEQLDEGGSDTLSLQNLDRQAPHPPPPSDSLLPNIVQVNPIDKLYLMQNSYFSTEQ
jgi:LIM homeobox transcription factor 1